MKSKIIGLSCALLFILSSAIAAYSQCALIDHHSEFTAADRAAQAIHCADADVKASLRAPSATLSQSDNFGKLLQTFDRIFHSGVSAFSPQNDFLSQSFSQQGLFRLVEVYRL